MIEEDKLYFVQMAGAPLMALLMGKRLHAPNVGYVVEEGAVCPDPEFPLPRMMLGSSGVHFRAVQWTSMLMVDSHAALGFMDYGLLAALQVDRFGNFNSTFISAARSSSRSVASAAPAAPTRSPPSAGGRSS